jgi:hypothetical protein
MFTTVGTLVLGAMVLSGYLTMKAGGARRFARGMLLLPKTVILAVLLLLSLPFRLLAGLAGMVASGRRL